jgi:hypothetical protein
MNSFGKRKKAMKKQYSREEKRAYFKALRERWRKAKELSEQEETEIQAIMMNHGLNISISGFVFVQMQMKAQGLPGIPYIDAKTYQGWRESGFQVRKGEKSTLNGLTWVRCNDGSVDDQEPNEVDSYVMPKEYHLFHKSQVVPIN